MKLFNLHVGLEGSAEKEACIRGREGTRNSGNRQAEAQKGGKDRGMGE